MCLPDSILVKEMVNDLRGGNASLHKIGLRMHTLTDTWAHMYFSGVAAWFTNDVLEGGPPVSELPVPPTPYYNSFTYLGHCRCGHYPDYGYKQYDFKPQWSDKKIRKNNPEDFLKALKQIIEALSCIRNNKAFDVRKYATIDADNEKIIKAILTTQKNDQIDTWKENIPLLKNNGKNLEIPVNYDADKWLNEAKKAPDIKKTDYYAFNQAAVTHLAFVKDTLSHYGIFLDNIPDNRILRVKIKEKKDSFISESEYCKIPIWPDPAPYPTLGNKAIFLELILPTEGPLKNNTNIKIRTSENQAKFEDKKYLGAWETPSIYYYIKDYNIFKQKWLITQEGLAPDAEIDLKKPVLIKNKHFDKQPYLYPYSYFGKMYLTTHKNKKEWVLEQ